MDCQRTTGHEFDHCMVPLDKRFSGMQCAESSRDRLGSREPRHDLRSCTSWLIAIGSLGLAFRETRTTRTREVVKLIMLFVFRTRFLSLRPPPRPHRHDLSRLDRARDRNFRWRIPAPLGAPLRRLVRLIQGDVQCDQPVGAFRVEAAHLEFGRRSPSPGPSCLCNRPGASGSASSRLSFLPASCRRAWIEWRNVVQISGRLVYSDGQTLAEDRRGLVVFLLLDVDSTPEVRQKEHWRSPARLSRRGARWTSVARPEGAGSAFRRRPSAW